MRKATPNPHRLRRAERGTEYTRYHCTCGWRSAWYKIAPDAQTSLNRHTDLHNKQEPLDYRQPAEAVGVTE